MPIKLDGKTFEKFKHAVKYIKRRRPGVRSPGGYVASIEKKQRK
jgi:hypothetical protein